MERLSIDKIISSEIQIKLDDKYLFEKLKYSLKNHNQIRNIIVCETENDKYECLEGHKILKAMQELGHTDILAINVGKLSENEKNAFRLHISKDYFITDYVNVAILLKNLKENKMSVDEMAQRIPIDKKDIQKLIRLTDFNWEEFNNSKEHFSQVSLFDVEDIPKEEFDDDFINELKNVDVKPKDWKDEVLEMTEGQNENLVKKLDEEKPEESQESSLFDLQEIPVIEKPQPVIEKPQPVIEKPEPIIIKESKELTPLEVIEKQKKEMDNELFEFENDLYSCYGQAPECRFIIKNTPFQNNIIQNIPYITKTHLSDKFNVDVQMDNVVIEKEENEDLDVIVKNVLYTNEWGVKFRMCSKDFVKCLNKIDFDYE